MHAVHSAHLFLMTASFHTFVQGPILSHLPLLPCLLLIFTRERSIFLFWRPDVGLWYVGYAVPQAVSEEVCRKAEIIVQVKRVAGEGDKTESEAKEWGRMSEELRRKVTEYGVSLETLRGSGRWERRGWEERMRSAAWLGKEVSKPVESG